MTALAVRNLQKIFPNGTVAVNNVSFNVAAGDFFALLGQNGAGKSTTIGIIASLVNKSSGEIAIFGHDLDRDLMRAKRLMGIMTQEINLAFFETVINTLIYQAGYYGLPYKIAYQRAKHLLQLLELWPMRNKQIVNLSGGMKRRLMLARALISKPKLLILDEPTAGVDLELRHLLWDFLARLNSEEGTTIILTTHYLEEAEMLCKNLAIIDGGQIIAHDSMRSLLSKINETTVMLDFAQAITDASTAPAAYKLQIIEQGFAAVVTITPEQNLNDLFAWLNQHNVVVISMRNIHNRLEELFMKIINHHKTNSAGPVS